MSLPTMVCGILGQDYCVLLELKFPYAVSIFVVGKIS